MIRLPGRRTTFLAIAIVSILVLVLLYKRRHRRESFVSGQGSTSSTLTMGESLVSGEQGRDRLTLGSSTLVMQTDSNLVLYDAASRPIWASGIKSGGRPPYRAVMQTDGNLVVYDATNKPMWASATNQGPGVYVAQLLSDRVEVVKTLWSSAPANAPKPPGASSATSTPAPSAPSAPATNVQDVFSKANIEFGPGTRVLDCKGGTCKQGTNLQIYDRHGGPNQTWTYDPKQQSISAQGHCVDVAGAGKANGTNVHSWPCYDGPAQKWVIQNNIGPGQGAVQLMNPNSGKCLEVAGGVDKNGQNVQIWDCKQSLHSWDIRESGAAPTTVVTAPTTVVTSTPAPSAPSTQAPSAPSVTATSTKKPYISEDQLIAKMKAESMFSNVRKFTIRVLGRYTVARNSGGRQAVIYFKKETQDENDFSIGLLIGLFNRVYTNKSRRLFSVVENSAKHGDVESTVALRTFSRTDMGNYPFAGPPVDPVATYLDTVVDVFAFSDFGNKWNEEMDNLPVW